MRPWRRLVWAAPVVPVAAVCLLATGCGGSALALDPVASAATKTEDAGSYKIDFDMSVSAGGEDVHFTGDGFTDTSTGSADLDFGFSGLPSTIAAGGSATGQLILANDELYMELPVLQAELPGGKQWLELDLAKVAQETGRSLGSFGRLDPQQWLQELLASGQAKAVGQETVQGEQMTHYHADLDPSNLSQVPASDRAQVGAALQQLGVTTIPVDVWVDSNGLVRQEKLALAANGSSFSLTTDLSDFGTAVSVTPPPAADVFDATALVGAAGNKA